jgi:prophage regulatory protein
MNKSMESHVRILRLREVKTRTGLARSTIYQQMEHGGFPKQIRLGLRSVGWVEGEIESWIASRIEHARKT